MHVVNLIQLQIENCLKKIKKEREKKIKKKEREKKSQIKLRFKLGKFLNQKLPSFLVITLF